MSTTPAGSGSRSVAQHSGYSREGLWFARHGHGDPILLMHGGLGWDHTLFRPWLDRLGDQFELIYYDHRGNGRSSPPEARGGLDDDQLVEDAEALRAELGLDRIVLFGHSYGGFLAQKYARRYPERLRGLVLCSTAPIVDFGETIIGNARERGAPEQLDAVLRLFTSPVPDDGALAREMRTILPLYFHTPTAVALDDLADRVEFRAGAGNYASSRGIPTFDVLGRIGSIQVPTLVLVGDDDWVMPAGPGAQRIQAAISGSRMEVIPKTGHFPWIEEPDRFVSVVRDWLARLA